VRVSLVCPAKLNLFLAVGPLAASGWHPVRTVMQTISIADELVIERSGGVRHEVLSDWPDLPEENTLTKTLRLAAEYIEIPPLRIQLTKRIPAQSGLGGGSSDAGGLLRALNRFLMRPLAPAEMQDIACAVGADVPFFLHWGSRHQGTAKAEGFGEQVTGLPSLPPLPIVVAKPSAHGPTAEMYQRLDEQSYPFRPFPDLLGAGHGSLSFEPYNDFERVAPCECLELKERMQIAGASQAALTGSGSAVYGVFASEADAESAAIQLRSEGWPLVEAVRFCSSDQIN
jgi:4-diphosphocytidyl-2-C-methyl-D-erythritol kinase